MQKSSHLLVGLLVGLVFGNLIPAQAQQSAARIWNEQLLAAIRINVPNPPAHARNLFHTAAAMYSAWAAYDTTAIGFVHNEKINPLPGSPAAIELARHEAVSYAAYRVLRSRFSSGAGAATTLTNLNNQLTALGYSTTIGQSAVTTGTTPAELGKRVGQAILDWGAIDQFTNTTYPTAYNSAINPNMLVPLSVFGTNAAFSPSMPLGYGIPSQTNPNFWQPLDLLTGVSQNGIPVPGGPQTFIGVQSLATWPFSLTRSDPVKPWIDPGNGPSKLSFNGQTSSTDAEFKQQALGVIEASSLLNDPTVIDISPGTIGNNPLGTDTGSGFPLNPVTGMPYTPDPVKRGDYVRVLAEYWADGPNSETPPGHWHVIANQLADNPATVKKIGGIGPGVNDLEWDVKTYFSVAGATHDAACAAWALKRYYSGMRPITMIRYMGSKGQSSDPNDIATYHSEGLPLMTDVVEVITTASTQAGGKHFRIWDVAYGAEFAGTNYIGQIAVKSWPGEHPSNLPAPSIATNQSLVRWMLAKDWLPFQRKTFNTPAFPGYVSGHSTFSRAAAEALVKLTGSIYFPGGFSKKVYPQNSMQIDLGPSADVELQWCTYYDAADQAGQSRRWGGIHPSEDDFNGRIIGAQAGKSAYDLAEKYWTGNIVQEKIIPTQSYLGGGAVAVTSPARRGLYYRLERATDLAGWQTVSGPTRSTNTTISFTDPSTAPGPRFYRVVSTAATAP